MLFGCFSSDHVAFLDEKQQEIVDMNGGGIFMDCYMLQVSSQWVCFLGADVALVIYNLWTFGGSILDLEDCIDWTHVCSSSSTVGEYPENVRCSCCFFAFLFFEMVQSLQKSK